MSASRFGQRESNYKRGSGAKYNQEQLQFAGEGRFFRFFQNIADGVISNSHGVCHYWLCDRCSESLTLRYRAEVGIVVVDRLHQSASPRNLAA